MSGDKTEADKLQDALTLLHKRGIQLDRGLSDSEFEVLETRFDFQFPPDLRSLLQSAVPVGVDPNRQGGTFPDWRSCDFNTLLERLNWPFDGMAFDIENNVFWLDEWGAKPIDLAEAIKIARDHVEAAPKLIPLYAHRYIPAEPNIAGNPVFSVHQTDIIYYGQDLWDYIEQEFGEHEEGWYGGQRYADFTPEQYHSVHRCIPFWSDLVS
ncbi:SMI1/KNR4 family protein [Gimesia algae]|uniref:SMI1 / KNR4 family protein n=1 Tax=Gimesia algae TaxID=2527971 RepID=A0A517VFG9_9PLAN|nr:SMI1/KNR4 family protein [Gimesia algae]QDT91758.1 hypothetical protein Pan161_34210 [Gimesia algae]